MSFGPAGILFRTTSPAREAFELEVVLRERRGAGPEEVVTAYLLCSERLAELVESRARVVNAFEEDDRPAERRFALGLLVEARQDEIVHAVGDILVNDTEVRHPEPPRHIARSAPDGNVHVDVDGILQVPLVVFHEAFHRVEVDPVVQPLLLLDRAELLVADGFDVVAGHAAARCLREVTAPVATVVVEPSAEVVELNRQPNTACA